MDELDEVLSQGTLSDLERLEKRAEQLMTEQDAFYEKLTKLNKLQQRLTHLRARRDKLRTASTKAQSGPLSLLESMPGENSTLTEEQRALLLKKHQLEETKAAYRLLGQSLTAVSRRTLRLCIDTSYDGEFGSPCYVEVRLDADSPVITRHTLPAHIPLEEARKVLKGGIQPYMDYIQGYLQAHHVRKGFAQKLQDHESALVGDVETTPSIDWVKFTVAGAPQYQEAVVVIQLKYDDLSKWLPTRVKASLQGEGSDDENEKRSQQDVLEIIQLFKTTDLPEAVNALIGQ